MKKKFLCFLLVISFIMPIIVGFAGCKAPKIDLFTLYVNLNGGEFIEKYKTEHNLTETTTTIQLINIESSFDSVNESLTQFANLWIVNGAKRFAGWYFDESCTDEQMFSKETFSNLGKTEEDKSRTIYARWIESNERLVILDSNNGNYTEAYKTSKGISNNLNWYSKVINRYDIDGFIASLPTSNDLIAPEGKLLDTSVTWALQNYYYFADPVNKERLEEKINEIDGNIEHWNNDKSRTILRIYANWMPRPKTLITMSLDTTALEEVNGYFIWPIFNKTTYDHTNYDNSMQHTLEYYTDDVISNENFNGDFSIILNDLFTIDKFEHATDLDGDDYISHPMADDYNLVGWKMGLFDDDTLTFYYVDFTEGNLILSLNLDNSISVSIYPVFEAKD